MDGKRLKEGCICWIREWFTANAPGCSAVIGMSGGKDSTVAAALCAEALGRERVIGIAMPAEGQSLNEADEICKYLGIRYFCMPIGGIVAEYGKLSALMPSGEFSVQTVQNVPPRVRMAVLFAAAQTLGGIVANTCNLSEDYVGYATLFGDAAGSFAPLGKLVVREIRAIGHSLGLPAKWVDKTPDDGLPNSMSDEKKFGFTYDTLDHYIREGVCEDPEIRAKIDSMHKRNLFKTEILHIPAFDPFKSSLDRKHAILITHGTDTMAWTLAALRYAIKNNNLNIAITGSQIRMPDGVGDFSDAYANIASSVKFLSGIEPPKIFTVFNNGEDAFSDSIYKVDRWDNKAFSGDILAHSSGDGILERGGDVVADCSSLEKLYVVTTGGTIESEPNSEGVLTPNHNRLRSYIESKIKDAGTEVIFKQACTIDSSDLTFDLMGSIAETVQECFKEIDSESDVSFDLKFDKSVRIIFTDPFKTRANYLSEMEGASAVIIAGYGAGNINIKSEGDFSPLELIREKAAGIPIVLTSQVALGAADFAYDNSWQAIKAGAISGVDMSIPEIQVRLAYIMGHADELREGCKARGIAPSAAIEWLFMSGVNFRTQKSREMYETLRGISFSKEDVLAGQEFSRSLALCFNALD